MGDDDFWIRMVIGSAATAFAAWGLGRIVYLRYCGRPLGQWVGGIPLSFRSAVGGYAFFACGGLFLLTWSPCLLLLAFPLAGVLWWFERGDRRREVEQVNEQWERNAERYPILKEPPPQIEADELPDQPTFAAFHAVTGEPIGDLTREQLAFLIRWQAEVFEPLLNDLMIMEMELERFQEEGEHLDLVELLLPAFDERNDMIVLRWTMGRSVAEERSPG